MCQYTPDNKRTKNTNQTKMCAIMVFYVYFVLYIELLFGNVGLNGSLKTYVKRWYIDIATNEDKYYEVFSYTAEKDCFVFICAETYYTSPQPLGLKISVESSIYAGNDDSYQIISKIESNNYNEIATSCNVYVRSGRKIKIEERISSTGHLTGGVAYQVVPV